MEAIIVNNSDRELTLVTLSIVKASIIFWEHTEIQTEIQNYFSNNDKDTWKLETFHKITGKVLDLANVSVEVVPALLPELKDAIVNTGVKIYNWVKYVTSELGLNASYAKKIYWTALGFVDHEEIFESIWAKDVSLFEGSPCKPIFRVACLLTQVDFVEKHEADMMEELEELILEKNLEDHFELENYAGKTYGIISTYLCYYLYQNWQQNEMKNGPLSLKWGIQSNEFPKDIKVDYFNSARDFENVIDDYINQTILDGEIFQPFDMAILCGYLGSIYGLKYYYGELNSSEKRSVNDWTIACCVLNLEGVKSNYTSLKYKEILGFIYTSDPDGSGKPYWENQNVQINIVFNFCPLESVVWKRFIKWLNEVECNRNTLNNLLGFVIRNVKSDYFLKLPVKRSLYQKLLKEIWRKVEKSKIKHWKKSTDKCFIGLFAKTDDFTNLKTFFTSCEWDLQEYLSYIFSLFNLFWSNTDSLNFDGIIKFFNEMFESSEDLGHFYNKQICESLLLTFPFSDFEKWENLYTGLSFSNKPLRTQIDPVKCLSSFIGRCPSNIESCDKFIRWWANSEEDQLIVKDKFKRSFHAFEFLYCLWLSGPHRFLNDDTLNLFQWLFGSDGEAIQQFKKKVSIMGLLDYSFKNPGCLDENKFHSVLEQFINYFEISAEDVSVAKKEVRGKIKELVLNHAKIKNILTLEFLMDWVLTSEKDRKEIYQQLIDSGKMFDLCEEALTTDRIIPGYLVFYNKWLKLFGNVSMAKSHIISIYKDEADDDFMSKLSFIYEKLERGEDLISDEIVLDR